MGQGGHRKISILSNTWYFALNKKKNAMLMQILHPSLIPSLIRPGDILSRERTESVLDCHHLVCALLAGLDHLTVLSARFVASLQHMALGTTLGVGAAGVRELKGRRTPEVKHNLNLGALMDIRAQDLALRDSYAGDRVDSLLDLDGSAALGRLVADSRNGKVTRRLGNATEAGRRLGGLALRSVKGVPHIEGRRA